MNNRDFYEALRLPQTVVSSELAESLAIREAELKEDMRKLLEAREKFSNQEGIKEYHLNLASEMHTAMIDVVQELKEPAENKDVNNYDSSLIRFIQSFQNVLSRVYEIRNFLNEEELHN